MVISSSIHLDPESIKCKVNSAENSSETLADDEDTQYYSIINSTINIRRSIITNTGAK